MFKNKFIGGNIEISIGGMMFYTQHFILFFVSVKIGKPKLKILGMHKKFGLSSSILVNCTEISTHVV